MNTAKKASNIAMATAAASFFLGGATLSGAAVAEEAKVKCWGVNACKGQTQCGTSTNACAGQNSCKGHGWLMMTEKECSEKGGRLTEK